MTLSLPSTLSIASLCLLTLTSLNSPILANTEHPSVIAQNMTTSSQKFTEESIKNVLTMMEKAREQKNPEDVLKYIAPFAYSIVTVDVNNNTIILTLEGIEEHRDFLSETYGDIKDRKILNRQVDVRLSTDQQMGIAVIQEQIEYVTPKGDKFLSSSVNTLRFGLVNGQPMVVSATLKGWLSPTMSGK